MGGFTASVGPEEARAYAASFTAPRSALSLDEFVADIERGRTTAQALLDGHRRLARQLFAGLPDDVFDGFDAGLFHVLTRFRGVLAAQEPRTRP